MYLLKIFNLPSFAKLMTLNEDRGPPPDTWGVRSRTGGRQRHGSRTKVVIYMARVPVLPCAFRKLFLLKSAHRRSPTVV